jgi:hypothetical protein
MVMKQKFQQSLFSMLTIPLIFDNRCLYAILLAFWITDFSHYLSCAFQMTHGIKFEDELIRSPSFVSYRIKQRTSLLDHIKQLPSCNVISNSPERHV